MINKTRIEPFLDTYRATSDGLYSVYIRITINGDRAKIGTGYSIAKATWDDKNGLIRNSHPSAQEWNNNIKLKITSINKRINEFELKEAKFTAKSIKELLTNKAISGNIFDFLDGYFEEIGSDRAEGSMAIYKRYYAYLLEFNDDDRELSFDDFDDSLLLEYKEWLREWLSDSTVYDVWKILISWFNAALSKKLTALYPFDNFENPKSSSGKDKAFLTIPEIEAIEDYVFSDKNKRTRCVGMWFLFGCYTGLRVSDWMSFDFVKNISSDRIVIRAAKNNRQVSMRVYERMKPLLTRIRNYPLAMLHREKEAVPKTKTTRVLNTRLKMLADRVGIDKSLSTHCARKTFAVTICAEQGVSLETCAAMMGISVAVCAKHYYSVTNTKVDREMGEAFGRIGQRTKLKAV